MSHRPYQPVLLIGAARSGTKMLRDLIALHPLVDRVPYDVNFIWRLGNESLPHDELDPQKITPQIARRIRNNLETFHNGRPYLIEKTVSNCLRIPYLEKIYPDTKYIFLIRDGVDVVESVYRQWIAPPDWNYIIEKSRSFPFLAAPGYALKYLANLIRRNGHRSNKTTVWGPRYLEMEKDLESKSLIEVCMLQWIHCIEKACLALEKIESSRKFMVRYEDIVNEPRHYLTEISAFLNIDPSPYYSHRMLTHVTTANIGKGRQGLSQIQDESLMPIFQQIMNKFGYSAVEFLEYGAPVFNMDCEPVMPMYSTE